MHAEHRSNGTPGEGDDRSRSSSRPIAVPGGANDGNAHDLHHGNRPAHLSFFAEDTPLLTSPSSLSEHRSNGRFSQCRPHPVSVSPWGTDGFLSCSPMVSGPRANLRLPDLDLREARRAAAAAANARLSRPSASAEFPSERELRRNRSKSLGSESERRLDGSNHSSPLLLGEAMLKRRTPSGLSLLDLTDGGGVPTSTVVVKSDRNVSDNHRYNEGYGATSLSAAEEAAATAITAIYTEPLKEAEEQPAKPMQTSQSCTIHDLNPPPAHEHTSSSEATTSKIDTTDDTLLEELRREFEMQSNPPVLSLLYGLVNASIVLPILMSFGSIIYHDDFFRPYLSVLMKLTVVSGAVHQVTFSTVSSLPFAVGQVQDAGLIFLSAMARDLVGRLKFMGVDDTSILATVTVALSLYTAILGMALIVVGRFRLASYCQLLPSSVVGGYLAYIGFFCGQAGLALMASVDVTGLAEWYKFLEGDALLHLAPGVLGGCAIYYSVRTFRHMAVLPTCIVLLMLSFYAILWGTGTSVKEATKHGWINETVESPTWYHTWDFLRLSKVVWSVLPTQTLTLIAMISVVALSSSLDIAAIEIELKRPLDYNHELKTVGISNIISGLTGGYTGSYIFSQTIFSLRQGIRSRLMGYILSFVCLVAVVVPFNILAYIPNFFFGSLLMLICLDLLFEWLIDVREKVTSAEYVILLATFALLQVLGVEFGIIGGCILYVVVQRMGFNVGRDEKLNGDDVAMTGYEKPMQNE